MSRCRETTAGPLRFVLYEPEIPQNTGAIMRLCGGLGVALDRIEPCGFRLDDRRPRRAGMDDLTDLEWTRHAGWSAYRAVPQHGRLLRLTTAGNTAYTGMPG